MYTISPNHSERVRRMVYIMFVSEVLAEAQGELMRLDGVGTAGYALSFIRLSHPVPCLTSSIDLQQ